MGFYVRSGKWIDGIQLLTSQGRKSEIYGNATGGSGSVLWKLHNCAITDKS